MRRSKAIAVLDDALWRYSRVPTAIAFEASFVADAFREALARVRALNSRPGFPHSRWAGLDARDIDDESIAPFPLHSKLVEGGQFEAELANVLNGQLRWLLVSAYEAYGRGIRALYGALGYLDRNLWVCDDFGAIAPREIASMDLPWFEERARHVLRRKGVDYALKRMREGLDGLDAAERRDLTKKDHRFWIVIIGLMRHSIVHSKARLEEPSFWESARTKTGLNEKGSKLLPTKHRQLVLSLTRSRRGFKEIYLLPRRIPKYPTSSSLVFSLTDLLHVLTDHMCLVYKYGLAHFRKEPYWMR